MTFLVAHVVKVLRITLARFFTGTGGILLVVAAGLLSEGVPDLQEAGFLPGLNSPAFTVSGAIPSDSWFGTLLNGTLTFSPAATWLELAVWLPYLVPALILFILKSRPGRPAATALLPH